MKPKKALEHLQENSECQKGKYCLKPDEHREDWVTPPNPDNEGSLISNTCYECLDELIDRSAVMSESERKVLEMINHKRMRDERRQKIEEDKTGRMIMAFSLFWTLTFVTVDWIFFKLPIGILIGAYVIWIAIGLVFATILTSFIRP